jgi:hypothetical protein
VFQDHQREEQLRLLCGCQGRLSFCHALSALWWNIINNFLEGRNNQYESMYMLVGMQRKGCRVDKPKQARQWVDFLVIDLCADPSGP